MAVFGDDIHGMAVRSTSTFWQHPLGSVTGDGIQSALLGTFPALLYDSYVTIGSTEFNPSNGLVELAESPDAEENGFLHSLLETTLTSTVQRVVAGLLCREQLLSRTHFPMTVDVSCWDNSRPKASCMGN